MAEDDAIQDRGAFILGATPFDTHAIRAFVERIVDSMHQRPEAGDEERRRLRR